MEKKLKKREICVISIMLFIPIFYILSINGFHLFEVEECKNIVHQLNFGKPITGCFFIYALDATKKNC